MIGFVMIGALPLIADIGDVIGIIVFLVIGLLSVVSQIMNKAKEDKQNAGPRPGQRPHPQARPQQQQQRSLANEIDQFVQQASQRRGGGGPQQAPAQSRASAQPRGASQPLVEAVPVELLEPMAEESGSVGARSLGSLGSGDLESEVDQADENMEEHVHDVFDHKLGQLGRTPDAGKKQSDAAAVPPTAAAGLAAMLTDPANVRQAIVLSEILQRPEQRWG